MEICRPVALRQERKQLQLEILPPRKAALLLEAIRARAGGMAPVGLLELGMETLLEAKSDASRSEQMKGRFPLVAHDVIYITAG